MRAVYLTVSLISVVVIQCSAKTAKEWKSRVIYQVVPRMHCHSADQSSSVSYYLKYMTDGYYQ